MDYEKAYKTSLKTAAQWIKDGCTDKEKICLECVFLELRESEDERIRKWLLGCVENLSDVNFIEVSRQDVLFYLEKQKDSKVCEEKSKNFTIQKEQKKDNPFEDFLRGYDAGYLHGIDDRVNKKVKPPVEWLKRKKEQKLDTIDADDLQLLGFIYDLLNEIEWKDNWAMSKDECLRRLNNYRPQKPAEWSEEDGPFDEDEFLEDELSAFLQNYDKEYDDDAAVSDVAKHFYEIGKKQKEQKPVQTSEEKEYIRTLKSLISDFIRDKQPEDVVFYQKIYDWLDGRHIEQMMDEWLKDRDGCFWDGVEEGKKAMKEQMLKDYSWLIAPSPNIEPKADIIHTTDTAPVDGNELLHVADKSYKIGWRDCKEKMLRIAKNRYEQAMTFVTGNSEVDQAIQMDRLALVKIIEEDGK